MRVLITALVLQLAATALIPPNWAIVKPTMFTLSEVKQRLINSLQALVPPTQGDRDRILFQPLSNITEAEVSSTAAVAEENLLFIPRELINPTMFETLGLSNLFERTFKNGTIAPQKWLNFTAKDQVLIPQEFKTYLLFNTTTVFNSGLDFIQRYTEHRAGKSYRSSSFSRFLANAVPFEIPKYLELTDYYLVIPGSKKLQNLSSNVYNRGLLMFSKAQLPAFRSQLSEDKPLIVFMFNETEPRHFLKSTNNGGGPSLLNAPRVQTPPENDRPKTTPIMSIKDYLKQNQVSNFFDRFANLWIKQVGYDSLISAVFCNIQNSGDDGEEDTNQSYCLKIKNQMIDVFPAYQNFVNPRKGHSKLHANSLHPDPKELDSLSVESQAVRQVHDKLQAKKYAMTLATLSLLKHPKQTIEAADEVFDKKVDEKLTSLSRKKDHLKDSLDDRKTALKIDLSEKKAYIEDKSDALADKISRKRKQLEQLHFQPKLFDKSDYEAWDMGDYEWDCDYEHHPALCSCSDDESPNKIKSKFEVDEGSCSDGDETDKNEKAKENEGDDCFYAKDKKYASKRSEILEEDSVEDNPPSPGGVSIGGGFTIPLSLLHFDDLHNYSPRRTSYSQVINLDSWKPERLKKRIEFSDDITECKPITWYNLFHYSIFGDSKLCNDEVKLGAVDSMSSPGAG
ncbi:uncharacterized protein LODBEIA_P16090 [Lodderomyces beijingensis]|uniref:Uncharacterized protein n=1 Tax=Lodderomyces beijingensis TaxID=1775926 RepID=A0ABP0ZJK9_9ASCO